MNGFSLFLQKVGKFHLWILIVFFLIAEPYCKVKLLNFIQPNKIKLCFCYFSFVLRITWVTFPASTVSHSALGEATLELAQPRKWLLAPWNECCCFLSTDTFTQDLQNPCISQERKNVKCWKLLSGKRCESHTSVFCGLNSQRHLFLQ